MKQVVQDLRTGKVSIHELPVPSLKKNHVIIKSHSSLISVGTEKMLLSFGKAGWISKARQQPDKVKMVLEKIKTDGAVATFKSVQNKLSEPLPLGYSMAGEVIAVGDGVMSLKVGDHVISNGPHAEVVICSENLCAKIPDNVSTDEASFVVVASIALQSIRLLNPTLGETHVVFGLGLIGLITVQILKANGVNVIGFDLDPEKVKKANEFGANAFVYSNANAAISTVADLTSEHLADGVIITASTTSNDPIETSPRICRTRGRIILVGVVGLNINRTEFYKKEISFQVSCSYGPGRYDSQFEKKGLDYPIGFVRWTQTRNFQAILSLLQNNTLNFNSLITKKVNFSTLPDVYSDLGALSKELGVIVQYESKINLDKTIPFSHDSLKDEPKHKTVSIGLIGAGSFSSGTLLPEFKKANANFKTVCSSTGFTGNNTGLKFGFDKNTTDINQVFQDDSINTVVICTPHSSHGGLVVKSLEAGKIVFVEKPLATNIIDLEKIESILQSNPHSKLFVGFNRRFSPFILELKKDLDKIQGKKAITYTINAGDIPKDHWVQDLEVGGGRLIGEACHFIDLCLFLVSKPITSYDVNFLEAGCKDTFTISLKFQDGSIANINYFSNGNKSVSKEFLQVFSNGNILEIDNFRKYQGYFANGSSRKFKKWSQDKGHSNQVKHFSSSILSNSMFSLNPLDIIAVTRIAIELSKKIYGV